MITFAPINHGLTYPIGHPSAAPECRLRNSFLGCFQPKGRPALAQPVRPERRLEALNRAKSLSARATLLTLIYPGLQLSCGPQQTYAGPNQLKVGILEGVVFFR